MERLHLWHKALLIIEFNLHFIPRVTFDFYCAVLDNVSCQKLLCLLLFNKSRSYYNWDAACFYSVRQSTADRPLFSPLSIQEPSL